MPSDPNNPPDGVADADAKSLTYLTLPTFAEYLAGCRRRGLMETRLCEIRLPPAEQAFFVNYPDLVHLAVVVADDAPETIVVLPVLAHLAAMSPRLDLRVLCAEEAAAALARLTDDPAVHQQPAERGLPQVFAFDEEWQLLDQWDPRPLAAEQQMERWLARRRDVAVLAESDEPADQSRYRELLESLTQEMRLWYNSGLNRTCAQGVRNWLTRLHQEAAGNEPSE
jgi:hypothetical protein